MTSLSFFSGVDDKAYGTIRKGELLLDHKQKREAEASRFCFKL